MMKKITALVLCLIMAFGVLSVTAEAKSISQYKKGDLIEFGYYPERRVTDSSTISKLNRKAPSWDRWTSYDYYVGTCSYDDDANGEMRPSSFMRYTDVTIGSEKYRGVRFTAYRPMTTTAKSSSTTSLQDNNGYYTDTTYWFRYYPIKWRVLDPSTGQVISMIIMDSQAFNNYVYQPGYSSSTVYGDSNRYNMANKYATSSLHKWLNQTSGNGFMATAFTKKQIDSNIKTMKITYSSFGGGGSVEGKVFLPDYDDVGLNGFFVSDGQEARKIWGTDYAKCQGLYVGSGSRIEYCSPWWLYVPMANNARRVDSVDDYGALSSMGTDVDYTNMGVRPVLFLGGGNLVQPSSAGNTGFFARLIAFFRGLFGLDSVAMQEYLGYEFVD